MNLKELRIKKGLTQSSCASLLGMSLRNYQNYENNELLKSTTKYEIIYNKLNEYNNSTNKFCVYDEFNTNVITGNNLQKLYSDVENFKKRDIYDSLYKFVTGDYNGKVCILYGLRRTGKTTLLLQLLGDLPIDKCAYIKLKITDDMAKLSKDLNKLLELGYKYVFLDEVTLLSDFINTAAILSDIYSMIGMKIIMSGTDSLGFIMADTDELYDRNIMLHTSFISFNEYYRLLNIKSIDQYIEYGGTLRKENMSYDDDESLLEEVSFRDDESTRKYIDSSISRNIQHTLKNYKHGEYFNHLIDLYDNRELTNVINRIVENMNHSFMLKVIESEFKSSDFGSAKELLLHDVPNNRAYVLYDVDRIKIIEKLKKIIDIRETYETNVKVTIDHINQVKDYLLKLDLIMYSPIKYENGKTEDYYIFTQPGMRYSITKALTYSIMQDEYFCTITEYDKSYIISKIHDDIKGRMLEDIVILELKKQNRKNKEIFKFKFNSGGEFDIVIYDKLYNNCTIYEVKHSDKIAPNQIKNLIDKEKCDIIEKKYGLITKKYVLYRGTQTTIDGIEYINVEDFLINLKKNFK